MHSSVFDAPLAFRDGCMNFGWICMLMGGVFCVVLLSVCKTQGLVHLTLNTQKPAFYTLGITVVVYACFPSKINVDFD